MLSHYPFNESQDPDRLLDLLGSFWSGTFGGAAQARSVVAAAGLLDLQNYHDTEELLRSISRSKVPVFHVEEWSRLVLRRSALVASTGGAPAYGDGNEYGERSGLAYGDGADAGDLFSWPVPDGLVHFAVVSNRITHSSVTLVNGVDFVIADGAVRFYADPFADENVAVREVLLDNEVVDLEASLWVWRGSFDLDTVYRQFGYAVELAAPSSENYKRAVNAVYDGLVEGTSVRAVQELWSAACDVPLAQHDGEEVEAVVRSADALAVVTSRSVYHLHPDSELTVAVGDELSAGDTLSTALRFHEFTRGTAPDWLSALSVGRGTLAAGFFGDLVFENKSTPLVVEEDVGGYTKVSFDVGGLATDVEKFWADVHSAGIERGETLAELMDLRPADSRTTQPTALALPASVNPLTFLIANVLRSNAYVVATRPATFGRHALSAPWQAALRKLTPPHTLGVIVVALDGPADTAIMASSGTETSAGYSEAVGLLTTATVGDDVNGLTAVSERVRLRSLRGRCE